ncbi:1-acyl-sn-glycerol-3-phosphate acyltransferase [Myxococcota bacterium]|nr:1-acyl-sn-glycerol-3-phosphate acyltransferase [Myxococcota bacterium]
MLDQTLPPPFDLVALARGGRRVLDVVTQSATARLRLPPAQGDETPPLWRARARALARHARSLCASHGFDVRRDGALPERPVVFVANHSSYVDPIAVASLVPCAPVAKAEAAEWPIIGPALPSLGVLLYARGSAKSGAHVLRAVKRRIQAGVSVLIFPEGTTTDGRSLQPFQRGVFELATRHALPVVPVAITYDQRALHWTGDDAFVPHYLRTIARPRVGISVRFGPVMVPERFQTSGSFVAGVRWELRSLMKLEGFEGFAA